MSHPIHISPPGGGASPTFEQPFDMLHACHERVNRMLRLLGRLREHLRKNGADQQARDAARDVMRYFDQAAPQHHLDEERHVFPALESTGDAALHAAVQRLRADHRAMETGWAAARAVLAAVQDGSLGTLDAQQEGALERFARLYEEHIALEEGTAFPAASAALDAPAQRAMGEEMMRRRGVR